MCRNVLTWRQRLQQWVNPPKYWTLPLGLKGTGLTTLHAFCTFSPSAWSASHLHCYRLTAWWCRRVYPEVCFGLWEGFFSGCIVHLSSFYVCLSCVEGHKVSVVKHGSRLDQEPHREATVHAHIYGNCANHCTTALPRSKHDQVHLNLSPSSVGLSWPTDKLLPLAVASLDPWAAIMHQPLPATFIR